MSTVTHLEQFRGLNQFGRRSGLNEKLTDQNAKLRELWSDGLATLAVVTLASVVVFEALRVFLW